MNKKKLFIFLYLIIPILFIVPPVLAVPDVNITIPYGGETLFGTTTITFNVSDASKPQSAFDANIYYSASQGNKTNLITSDLNLFDYCVFSEGKLTSINTDFVKTGLTTTNLWTVPYESINLGMIDNNLVVMVIPNVGGSWDGFWWNESDSTWWPSPALKANLPVPSTVNLQGFSFFDYNSENYLLYITLIGGDYNAVFRIWNSTTEQWDLPSINFTKGLEIIKDMQVRKPNIVSYPNLILFTDNNSFVWDGSQWNANNYWFSNIDSALEGQKGRSQSFFVDDGILHVISAEYEANAAYFSEATGLWITDSSYIIDINSTIDTTKRHNITGINTYNDLMQVLIWEQTTNAFDAFELKENGFLTHISSPCSYSWDTTTAPNALTWYLDIVPFTSTASGLDSSNAFSILNWPDSEITCDCISNCSSCVLDINTFVIIPTSESSNVSIKINNLGTGKSVGRSEEHTSELQSHSFISYAVFCLKKKTK